MRQREKTCTSVRSDLSTVAGGPSGARVFHLISLRHRGTLSLHVLPIDTQILIDFASG